MKVENLEILNASSLDETFRDEVVLDKQTSISVKQVKLPSKEKKWLKFFKGDVSKAKVPELTLYEQLVTSNQGNLDLNALRYFENEITYKELINNIDNTAKMLVSLGVKKGDVVVICMPNQPETVYTFYALSKIGAIPSLIEPRTPAERIKNYVNDAKAKYMVTIDLCVDNISKMVDDSTLEKVVSVSSSNSFKNGFVKSFYELVHKPMKTHGKFLNWNECMENSKDELDVKTNKYEKGAVASIVYTGGTTGIPKGAQLSNESYNGQNEQLKYTDILPEKGDVFLGTVPIFSAYGSSSGMHNALSFGTEIVLIPKYTTAEFVKLIYKYRPTHIMGVPRQFEELASFLTRIDNSLLPQFIKDRYRVDFIKHLISGGDKYATENEKRNNAIIAKYGGPKIKKGIGMSEFGGGFVTTISDEANRIGSQGIPHALNNVKVIDSETIEEMTYGEVGEVYVTSPTMMLGYLNREDENEKFFEKDDDGIIWARTGDMGHFDNDGLFYFDGRVKYAIMRPDGHTVQLLPIESAIEKCKDVKECAVVGVQESKFRAGERPMAFVVIDENSTKTEDEIRKELGELCLKYLPEREGPKWFMFVDELPYTLLQKVDREKLKQIGSELLEKGLVTLNYSDKDSHVIERIKSKVLKINK